MPSRALAVGAALLALAACGEQDEPRDPLGPTGPTGRIRFVNAVSNATAAARPVNVRVGDLPLTANLGYGAAFGGSAAVPYYPTLAREHSLVVSRTADTATKVLERTVTVAENQDLTLIAVRGTDGNPTLVTRVDADNARPATGVKIRVTHAAPGAGGPLDVYVTPSAVTNITAIPPSVTALSFGTSSTYLQADAGNLTIRFTTAGTKTVVATATTGVLANGAVRSVLALEAAAGGTPLTTLVLVDR